MAVPDEIKDTSPVLPAAKASEGDPPFAEVKAPAEKATQPAQSSEAKPAAKSATPAAAAAGEKPAAAAKPAAPAGAAKPAAPAAKPIAKPEPWEPELVRKLKAHYGSGIREAATYVGQKYLVVDSSIVYEVLLRMHDDGLFDYLVDVTAVHYPKREAQFDIVYILYSFHNNERVRVKTQVRDGERLHSAVAIWPTANWLEREVYDMFGIGFEAHPELKRILMPDGWKGHPLRKDYPILCQDQGWVEENLGIESGQ